jgi:IS30 family transposase
VNKTVRQIAKEIGRSPSTISRELRRNTGISGRYRPGTAEQLAAGRLPRPRPRRLLSDPQLRAVVVELLGKRWSPEQVAHELPVRFSGQSARWLCTESVYQAIYDPDVPVTRPAKRRRRYRRRRVQGLQRRGRLASMTMIADRPPEVEDRLQAGRWEGDCIMGAANQSAIGTLVERRTRYLILIGVFHSKPTAEAVRDAITTTFQALPARLRRTLTWDQGKELALHQQITERTGTRVFFCDAHSPWQRGSKCEHERSAARLLPQRNRLARPHVRRTAAGRRRSQHAAPQKPPLGPASRSHRTRESGSFRVGKAPKQATSVG